MTTNCAGYGLKCMIGWNLWVSTHLVSITRFKAFDEKIYRWRFYTYSIYFKPNIYNFDIVVITNFDFTDENNIFYFNQSILTMFLNLTIKNCKLVNSKSNWVERGSFFRIFSLTFWWLCQVEGHGGTLAKLMSENCQKFP